MRLGGVPLTPRRLVAVTAGCAGLAVFVLVTAVVGPEAGLVLLAAGAAATGLVVTKLYRDTGRRNRLIDERDRAHLRYAREAAEQRQAEAERLSTAVRELRELTVPRLHAVEQVQQQVSAMAWWWRAEQRRQLAGPPARASRDTEIELIRGSDLFDAEWYQTRAGVKTADPVAHYVDAGASAGIDPHRLFAAAAYLERHPDALLRWRTPLAAYLAAQRDGAVPVDPPVVRLDAEGRPREADLRWEYLVGGLHREPDTFLYRIIGNDLPPRHRPGQSLDNLRFILANEPDLPGCRKRFVVNRIVDQRMETKIIALLEEHGQEYLHLPFDAAEYRQVGWRFSGFELPGYTYREEFEQLGYGQRQRVIDHVYHDKNLYVMNNNGARNAALREGRQLAKWVLPWDGNCFLTGPAWDDLVAAISERPHLRYFTVPMARVVHNEVLLRPDPVVDPSEEPQLVFRRDALEEFDPDARYGRRPKVELFYRLRIPGPWNAWGRVPWDAPLPAASAEAGQVGQAGWVARLFSGEPRLEIDSNGRQWRRIEAIWECINRVDQDLAREAFSATELLTIDERALDQQRVAWTGGVPGPARVVGQLIRAAEAVAGRRGRHSNRLPTLVDDVTVLTLAGYFSREARFFLRGAELLRASFLGRRAPLAPRRTFAAGPPRFAIAEAEGVHYLLDAVRLLEREGALAGAELSALRAWFLDYRGWLEADGQRRAERTALNHRGTWYDVQVGAISAYLDDVGGVLAALRRCHDRVGQQFEPDGSQPEELRGRRWEHDCVHNMQGWSVLAALAAHVDQDLWSYRTADGRGLAAALPWTLTRAAAAPPDRLDRSRLAVLAHAAARQTPSLPMLELLPEAERDAWQVRQVFHPGAGVRPFWALGSGAEPSQALRPVRRLRSGRVSRNDPGR